MNPSFFYKWIFFTYGLLWKIAVPLLRTLPRIREGFEQRTFHEKKGRNSDIWIQAASAGEAYLASQILKNLDPEKKISVHLTSYTSQGLQILEKAAMEKTSDSVSITTGFFPFDEPGIAEKAVREIKPKLLVLLESETWPGIITQVKRYGGDVVIINGRITCRSFRRQMLIPGLWRMIKPDQILAISPGDAERFSRLFNMDAVETMPNIKFDRMAKENNDTEDKHERDRLFLVLASIRKEEEAQACSIISSILKKRSQSTIGLFPRHMHRLSSWKKHLCSMGVPWKLKSEIIGDLPRGHVVLWDSFGELDRAYDRAAAAFVGGSLADLGGQNFLEPLSRGVTPVIGPHWEDFSWVGQEIMDKGLVIQAGNWQEASEALIRVMDNPRSGKEVRTEAQSYFRTRCGGVAKACKLIENRLV